HLQEPLARVRSGRVGEVGQRSGAAGHGRDAMSVREQSERHGAPDAAPGPGDDADAGAGDGRHRPVHSGLRLALNAAWNSAWSWVVIRSAWVIASSSMA